VQIEKPSQHATRVRFDNRNRLIKRKAGHCMRGVFPDSGKLSHLLDSPREMSAISSHNGFGRGVEISRASVIAEALPHSKHVIFRSACQGSEIGKRAEPLVIIGDYGGDLRLLQHELGNEDSVRIAGSAPWEIAPMPTIPTGKRAAKNGKVLWRYHGLEANVQLPTLNVQCRIQS
jgi:hypothetical protein